MYNKNSRFGAFVVLLFLLLMFDVESASAQQRKYSVEVNVFLGTSGDHGQLSPAASYPNSLLSVGPQTNPSLHAGYEYKAKIFEGFTHDRLEGVGCRGSGGIILIKPFICSPEKCLLVKNQEMAGPGYFEVTFTNRIRVRIAVLQNAGIEEYSFPGENGALSIDLSHSFANGFLAEKHEIKGNKISGWIQAGTTCREGAYTMYFSLQLDHAASISEDGDHRLVAKFAKEMKAVVRVSLSSVNVTYAEANLPTGDYQDLKEKSSRQWNNALGTIKVSGNPADERLFYSLYYRTLQSPYIVNEKDGAYLGTDGRIHWTKEPIYSGWSIWDNYRTIFPLLSISDSVKYQHIINSICVLYQHGKKNWATQNEPSNTVRTEHSIVVLLDAYRKGFKVDFSTIIDSLKKEVDSLDLRTPDKALESCYDRWAMSEICGIMGDSIRSLQYKERAEEYRHYWLKDFSNLEKDDVDRFGARRMYQGTIWQYRWLVPYDLKGLISLCGGSKAFTRQLDYFFDQDLYNAANETDLQAPYLYNVSDEPWKAQSVIRKIIQDSIVQFYSDFNMRGIDPQIGRVYNNTPDAFLRSMDDDAGAMSAWYLLAAIGLDPVCIGRPVYYIHAPLFSEIALLHGRFKISVKNPGDHNRYIKSISLNGITIDRNWITHEEIMKGGVLSLELSDRPNYSLGVTNRWMTSIE